MGTTYEKDGIEYESIVNYSYTMELLKAGGFPAMAMYAQIKKIRDDKTNEISAEMPVGLSDKSYLSRISLENQADAEAMKNFIQENYPVQYKRLFVGDAFQDFMTSITICAFDQLQDSELEKKNESVLALLSYSSAVNLMKKERKWRKKR